MTGYTVHTGSTGRFSEGWDRIFGRSAKSTKPSAAKASSQPKSAKKPAAGKRPKGKK